MKSLAFVWYVIPLLLVGVILSPHGLFQQFDNEEFLKTLALVCPFILLEQILAQWRRPVASRKAMKLLHWENIWYCFHTPPRQSKCQQSWRIFSLLSFCLQPWWPPGQYRASSCQMGVSSGFWCSPGLVALRDALRITPAHRHSYQNGQRKRSFVSHCWFFVLT